MIVPIGRWVLQEACRQMQEWFDAGLSAIPVAVNISALEFGHHDFLASVQLALDAARLNPRLLELEMTETVLMRNSASTARALEALKAIGVRLAIDDFGTGFSSLSYLTRFPVDAMKLDQSFVHGIGTRLDEAVIARAVIRMGKGLKHRVVAEGVETEEQVAFLQAEGCDEGQGYYFSRPVTPVQFARLLDTGITVLHPANPG
jgi:EAL domain-containing protein (putative c-di-GMP-specific phosphodiesterase class I)